MTVSGWALILLFATVTALLAKPMGLWLFALYEGRRTPLHRILDPVERGFYRLAGINPKEEQGWRRYALHMLLFNVVLLLFTYAILRLQGVLPGNPQGFGAVCADGAFNA
ncbi:MAG: potassium-transporting ATPase subunit KdpA, partial [Sphingopyxis sp.]|uniref:potassium-transporting ATPase subunit KdpA n=1 Tax=Sphingopyxis sp. TaxID=1908224 RepID=UPI003D6C7269